MAGDRGELVHSEISPVRDVQLGTKLFHIDLLQNLRDYSFKPREKSCSLPHKTQCLHHLRKRLRMTKILRMAIILKM